ncbi:MAG: FHA domain-containing protein [Armatimonadota bacterium]
MLDLTIILTIGKYAILVAIYAFVLVVFRGMMRQLAAESRRGRAAEAGASDGSRRVPRRRSRVRPAAERPAPPEVRPPSREPEAEPRRHVAPPQEAEPPVPDSEPAAASLSLPPERRSKRIDLLEESDEAAGTQPAAPREPEAASVSEPPASRENSPPHLLVLESADEALEPGAKIPLSAAVTIGRSEENSLQVTDRFISSRHALVCLRDGRRILVDRGSTNGTFVNGERVEDEVELSEGDRIALGNTVVEYHAG